LDRVLLSWLGLSLNLSLSLSFSLSYSLSHSTYLTHCEPRRGNRKSGHDIHNNVPMISSFAMRASVVAATFVVAGLLARAFI
jgi:hypothetical protein